MRLIHLTDPHLSTLQNERFLRLKGKRRSGYLSWYRKRRYVHRPEVLERITESVLAENADLILVTGDLVHIGLDSELAEAADWLRRFGRPERVFLIPGNHDNYAADSLANIYRHWGDYLPGTNQHPEDYTKGYPVERNIGSVQLLGLNSSCVTRIFSAAGEIGQQQRLRLLPLLDSGRKKGQFQVLLIHHPPFPGMTIRRKALRDDRELEELCRSRSPNLVLYGHLHRDRQHNVDDGRVYGTGSASYVSDASYRVFDIDETEQGWDCRMRLMKICDGVEGLSDAVLSESDIWSVTRPGQSE